MKILHTADWHLGKRLDKFSRLEEQQAVLEELIGMVEREQVDVVLVAGDLFDAFNPAAEAVELLYKSLKHLAGNGRRLVVAIAGNHDSPDRVHAPDVLARECGILFAGYPHTHIPVGKLGEQIEITKSEAGFIEVMLSSYSYPLRLLLTPYANEYRMKSYLGTQEEEELRKALSTHWQSLSARYCDREGINILMAHLFVMKKGESPPEEPDDEKPILHIGGAQAIYSEDLPDSLDYVALGHLHRYQEIDQSRMPIVYSSSLLSYSFSEAGQQKYVVLLEMEPNGRIDIQRLPLNSGKPLFRKRFESVEDARKWLVVHPDAWVELTIAGDHFMTSDDRKTLLQAHDGIVTIIPEIKQLEGTVQRASSIDLSKSIEDVFSQYFMHRYGQLPNEELMSLFKEIQAEQIDE